MIKYISTNTDSYFVKDHFSKLSEVPVYVYSIHTGKRTDQIYTSLSTFNLQLDNQKANIKRTTF